MGDWALVVIGGALASLLAGLIHRLATGWRAGGPSALDASGMAQTLRHGEASQSGPGGAQAKSRAEILRSEIEVLQANRRDEVERRAAGRALAYGGVGLLLLGFLIARGMRAAGKSWAQVATESAVLWVIGLGSLAVRWVGMRHVRRMNRRLRVLDAELDGELGLARQAR